MKLTEQRIARIEPEAGQKDCLVFDDEQRGLAVRASSKGRRTYLCQYTLHGQKYRVPLGACSALSLTKARQAAAAVMGDVAKGRNPPADRKEAAAAERAKRARDRLTLRVLIEDWRRLHLAGRRQSYADEAVRALHSAFADRLDDAAEDLDRSAVVRALDALTRRHKRKNGSSWSLSTRSRLVRLLPIGSAANGLTATAPRFTAQA
ncbi:MAG: Arm DNA-binding domain-containing protein [Xanthobacteraceae bacterium]